VIFDEKTNTWKQEQREVSNRRSGYDFCFAVPKSVSSYLVETGGRTFERLIHQSLKETICWIPKLLEGPIAEDLALAHVF
jgi:hypothetical protein